MGRACDDWDDDLTTEPLHGHASTADGTEDKTDAELLLLDLIADVTRLEVMLMEAAPAEFAQAKARLDLFQKRVINLPRASTKSPAAERTIGFKTSPVAPKPKKQRKKR